MSDPLAGLGLAGVAAPGRAPHVVVWSGRQGGAWMGTAGVVCSGVARRGRVWRVKAGRVSSGVAWQGMAGEVWQDLFGMGEVRQAREVF